VLLDRELALKRDSLGHGLLHGLLQFLRPGIERRAMKEERPRNVKVVRQRVKLVKLVHAIGHGVGERILLRVERAGLDHRDRFGEVHAQRRRADQLESAAVNFTRQDTDLHACHVGRHMNGPQCVGDVTEAVLEPAEDAVVAALLGLAHQVFTERPVHGRAGLRVG
jgi:hypothetical protein